VSDIELRVLCLWRHALGAIDRADDLGEKGAVAVSEQLESN
jgi:hypothetical protein